METKITRRDVAEQAGVSISVVSRALNNSGYVDKDKKQRVIETAERLGYVPNPVAMSLQQKRTKQIIFYCKDLTNAFNIDIYFGILEEAKNRGYVAFISGDMEFDNVRGMITDGIILQNEYFAEEYILTCGKNYFLPAVSASYGSSQRLSKAIPVVEWNLYTSMKMGIEYLRQRGHRKIAYASPYPFNHKDGRTNAWKAVMESEIGLEFRNYFICPETNELLENLSDFERVVQRAIQNEEFLEKGKKAGREFLKRKLDASAVICFNDEYTVGFVSQLELAGMQVPKNVSILSFDGTARRKMMAPEITSITPDPKEMGRKLAKTLIDRIEGKKISYYEQQSIRIAEGASVKNV